VLLLASYTALSADHILPQIQLMIQLTSPAAALPIALLAVSILENYTSKSALISLALRL